MKPLLLVVFSFLIISAWGQTAITGTNWKPNKEISNLTIKDTLTLTRHDKEVDGLLYFAINNQLKSGHTIKQTHSGNAYHDQYIWHNLGDFKKTATELTITIDSTTWALKPLFNKPNRLTFVVTGMGHL